MILIGLGLLVFGVVVSVLRSLDEIKKGQRDLGARLDALDARLSEAAERNWRPLAMMAISIAAAACTAPAQEADHFATLVTPPASAGTCMAGRSRRCGTRREACCAPTTW